MLDLNNKIGVRSVTINLRGEIHRGIEMHVKLYWAVVGNSVLFGT